MTDFFQAVVQVLQIVVGSSTATTLTVAGLLLLLLTAVMIYKGLGSEPNETSNSKKAALYLCLVAGIIFSAAGPALALYSQAFHAAQSSIRIMSTDEMRNRLAENARVRYVVRLIAYNNSGDGAERPQLSIDAISKLGLKLGPPKQLFSFVGDYEELKGRTVADAIDMIGIDRNYDRVTAIIFPLPRRRGDTSNFYPANARGLLQVIKLVETGLEEKERFIKPDTFNAVQLADLKQTDINTYPIKAHERLYAGYCGIARSYFCSFTYRSRELIGGLFRDWHPLGFSQSDPPDAPCTIPEEKFCSFTNWDRVKTDFENHFGGRAFLIENLDVNNIPGRIMIDFTDPKNQKIPEIALPPR